MNKFDDISKYISKNLNENTLQVAVREGISLEFKENYDWSNKDDYAKTIASFANNRGGYLIFGITNAPRILKGLSSNNFENQDDAIITSYLNSVFSPEINYEKYEKIVVDKRIGVIYVHQSQQKPIVAIKNDKGIKEAEIYYRYKARSEKIKFPELKSIFDNIREKERDNWMNLFEKISKIGPENVGVMDTVRGTLEGKGGSLLIDSKLVPKLKFIKDGHFSENGKIALKLIGDIKPVSVASYGKIGSASIRITDDPTAFAISEETILKQYPLDYFDLIKALRTRFPSLKINPEFHKIKDILIKNPKYCITRYLDPNKKKGSQKSFYSNSIIKEFDKHYKK
ncbi:MAG: ATP-binding protein [Candidatus Pacebacteria bacterium]|nr:ATP-binding protein [Candidatus Paceibacterota bacterium]